MNLFMQMIGKEDDDLLAFLAPESKGYTPLDIAGMQKSMETVIVITEFYKKHFDFIYKQFTGQPMKKENIENYINTFDPRSKNYNW